MICAAPMIIYCKKSELCYVIEQDKENDSRNAQATQAVIQRRRRPKRRSTGVVHVDMDVSNNFIMKLSKKCYVDLSLKIF